MYVCMYVCVYIYICIYIYIYQFLLLLLLFLLHSVYSVLKYTLGDAKRGALEVGFRVKSEFRV